MFGVCQFILARFWNHARIRFWNQPVLSNKGKVPWRHSFWKQARSKNTHIQNLLIVRRCNDVLCYGSLYWPPVRSSSHPLAESSERSYFYIFRAVFSNHVHAINHDKCTRRKKHSCIQLPVQLVCHLIKLVYV